MALPAAFSVSAGAEGADSAFLLLFVQDVDELADGGDPVLQQVPDAGADSCGKSAPTAIAAEPIIKISSGIAGFTGLSSNRARP